MTGKIKLTPLCAEFGMAHSRARLLLRQAGVEPDRSKLYDAEKARSVLYSGIDPQIAAGNRIAGRGNSGPSPEISALAASRVKTEEARYAKITLENELKAGRLVERSAVMKACEEFAAYVRSNLLSLPPKVAARLVDKSADDIRAHLDQAIREALTDLADVNNHALWVAP